MSRLLSLQFYFTPRPDPNFQYTTITVILIVLLFAAGVGITIYRRKYAKDPIVKKLIRKIPARLTTFGSVLLFLLISREVALPILSMRILWIVLFAVFIWWALKVILNFKGEYQRRLSQKNHHAKQARFIPKKKR